MFTAPSSQAATPTSRRRRWRVAGALVAAISVTGMTGLVALAPVASAGTSDEYAFLSHLNSLRAAHGLPGLSLAGDLTSIARQHSQAMLAQQTIFHNPNLQNEVANWQVLGENVGMGPSVSGIDQAFDNSPEHYSNEVNRSYTQVGIGALTDSRGEIFVTLDFRMPMNAAPVQQAVQRAVQQAAPVATVAHAPTGSPAPATHPAASQPGRPTPAAAPKHRAPTGNDPLAHALQFADQVGNLAR